MLTSQKHVFWNALLLTLFVFAAGMFMGFMIENWRTGEIASLSQESELQLLDVRVQNDVFSLSQLNCERAVEENILFGDRIYEESSLLTKYDEASRISESIKLQHRKYDLLRALFWVNSIKLREKCSASFHNVVYIYDYNNPRLDVRAKQSVFGNLLGELKQKQGNKIMLIPFAGDNELSSISTLMSLYNVSEEELPVVLIDEKIKIREMESLAQLEGYLV